MAFKIIWSPEAEKTFGGIIDYLEKNWYGKEIKNFISSTQKIISILQQNPFLFRGSEKAAIYEVLVSKHNLLLYQITENSKKVELLSFWDTRQHPKTTFDK